MVRPWVPEVDFSGAATVFDYVMSNARVRIIKGPVASGKTHGSCFELIRRACEQEPSPIDGLRRTKAAIIRNTMPDLRRTALETWKALFPPQYTGKFKESPPMLHHIKVPAVNWKPETPFKDQPKGAVPGIDMLIDFFALDQPKDVDTLLSYEATYIWFNELREIAKPILNAATDRVGRYPSEAKGGVMPTHFGVLGDTNPVEEDHWLHRLEEEQPEGYAFFRQPPGVLEAKDEGDNTFRAINPAHSGLVVCGEDYIRRAAGKIYLANPDAENIRNLVHQDPDTGEDVAPIHKHSYYLSRIPGKELDWIQCYYEGKDVYVREGKPVTPDFDAQSMVMDHVPILKGVPIEAGFDIGGGTFSPAAVMGQRHPNGTVLVHVEIAPDDMGVQRFSELFLRTYHEWFGDLEMSTMWGDPAARQRDPLFEFAVFDHLQSKGIPVQPASTNDIRTRIEAMIGPMQRFTMGRPGLIINRKGCPRLVKGLSGAWKYRRLQVSGAQERYAEKPSKDMYSHPCEAFGYWMLGGGEGKTIRRGRFDANQQPIGVPVIADSDFNVYEM